MIDNDSLPVNADDTQDQGPTEQELLDAVMKNSPIMDEVAATPEEEIPALDPAESEEDPESEEVVSEEAEESVEEVEEEGSDEDAAEAATQDTELPAEDDIDWEYQIPVVVDGETKHLSLEEIRKGYQTDQSLSKKGRELGEARKQLDEERANKLDELNGISSAANAMLLKDEQSLAKRYKDLEEQIDKARQEEDTYTLSDLKDKREQVQRDYWKARKQREGMLGAVQKQQQEVIEKQFQEQIEHFHKAIPEMIPDFNEKVAQDIRQFAIDKGISSEVLDQITDPAIVKFVDDFRRLEQGVSKGAAKRKVAPTRKSIPTKKAKSVQQKQVDKESMVKARAFKENASDEDQMNFLRQYASRSLNN